MSVFGTRGYTFSIGRSGYDGISVSGIGGNRSTAATSTRQTPLMIRGVASNPARIGWRPALAAVEGRRLLRVDEADARQRRFVAKVPFVTLVPRVDPLDDIEPAFVVQRAREFGEPRTQAVGRPVSDPDAHLGLALHRVLPAIRFLNADAENAADR